MVNCQVSGGKKMKKDISDSLRHDAIESIHRVSGYETSGGKPYAFCPNDGRLVSGLETGLPRSISKDLLIERKDLITSGKVPMTSFDTVILIPPLAAFLATPTLGL